MDDSVITAVGRASRACRRPDRVRPNSADPVLRLDGSRDTRSGPAMSPFRIGNPFRDPLRRALSAPLWGLLERALGLTALGRLYRELEAGSCRPAADDPGPSGTTFAEQALARLEIGFRITDADLAAIPSRGPLVVVANHPFGGADGLVLMALLQRLRPDVKLLGNALLRRIPELRDSVIAVDPFGGPGAAMRNRAPLRDAARWLRGGGALGIFPAGEVSHASWGRRRLADPTWSDAAARLARLASAPIVPVHFEGANSAIFQVLGLLHPRLRTLMLPRELLRRRGATIRVRAGTPVSAARIANLDDPAKVTEHLRLRVHVLGGRSSDEPIPRAESPGIGGDPIAPPEPAGRMAREVGALPPDQTLLTSGAYRVLHARAAQIPTLLREIGRLREIAFRKVGEGTGKSADLDRFDERYIHLFVWNERAGELVGAYRMGPTDEILPVEGAGGLYTSTLFHYRQELLSQLDPALELGRSFVRPEYQKSHAALGLLWKGIGRYVAAHPRYRRIFGPVSISNDYQSMSRQLLVAFLLVNHYLCDLGCLIRPRHRARVAPAPELRAVSGSTVVRSLDDVDDLVREIEANRRAVPVLLRQYLKLNGALLGFNVDPDFGEVLDGLMLVDLAKVDRHLLARYMGKEGAAGFRRRHGLAGDALPMAVNDSDTAPIPTPAPAH